MLQFDVTKLAAGLIIAVLVGWLLVLGKSILLPVLLGIIGIYVLDSTASAVGRVPGLRGIPRRLRRLLALLTIFLIVFLMAMFIEANAQAVAENMPRYQSNLNTLVETIMGSLGVEKLPDWSTIEKTLSDKFDVMGFLQGALTTVQGFGTILFMAILYMVFILTDLDGMPAKVQQAFGNAETAGRSLKIVGQINQKIGSYLSAKTLINVILATISFVIMLLLGIEFALFWAILIGLLNYIPYLGSILGVLFPVMLSLVQFTDLWHAGIAFVALMAAQLFVGNVLEPRLVGNSVNLSGFMVLFSLAIWTAMWGLAGTILAAPLTAVVMIILSQIQSTRPIAILMSENGEID
ncbi:AI-2E family transporter [Roseibium sp. RKSG952]|uniref:AI-2E family transporter n=1 Tax=Roseibium sp. RKSG952 TaxID=2529384 RepID=UPI0012BCD93E|nr:AI-2E family transporter [Roseibium sp. RKSG952]MTI01938.1 AI-2E family transporter [Roseibium sp. RKSG952]